jgi:streptomycin 6-kinase
VRQLPDKYKQRPTYLLWRDSAEHVDKVEQTIAESGDADVETIEGAIAAQHKAAQEAFDALMDGEDATKLLQKWEDACREMGVLVPDLSELAEGMITNLHNNKVFFGDVHGGNIGMVNGRWVVVDPGHVAVLEE